MSEAISKILDIFAKHAQKLPRAMIIFFLFAVLFPSEIAEVTNIVSNKIQIILPESFINDLISLQFSHEDLLSLWAFLLVLFGITTILDLIVKVAQGEVYIRLSSGVGILFMINSIIFLLVLIYNTLYAPGILIPLATADLTLFNFFILISACIFIIFFGLTYCADFIQIGAGIVQAHLSFKKKAILALTYIFFLCWICLKIPHIFMG